MEAFKKSKPNYILISLLILLFSCTEHSATKVIHDESLAIIDTFHVSDNLLKSSEDFVKRNNLSNANIEVDIDKKEFNQIYITFITRGIVDFEVRKFKPLFTYKIKNNLFFVFTGAEELLKIPFDTLKYQNRRQGRYDTILTAWYLFEGNRMQREDTCEFYGPFSSLHQTIPPPPINKNVSK
jgi:hypothetical protein